MFDSWDDDGATAMGKTPPPDAPAPGPMSAPPPSFPANVPLTKETAETPPQKELPEDSADRVPQHQAGYHSVKPELPEGQTWDESALGNFFGVAKQTEMKPSVVKAGLEYFMQSLGYLRTTASEGSFDTSLERLAANWKERAEAMGATPAQVKASIKTAVDWIEKHPDAIFGKPQTARMESPSPSLEDAAPIIGKMRELADRGLKHTREWNELQEKLTAHFSKRTGGAFLPND